MKTITQSGPRKYEVKAITKEDLSNEFNFLIAKRFADAALSKNLMDKKDYDSLMKELLKSYPTILGELE